MNQTWDLCEPLRIGSVTIPNPVLCAPMAGVSDLPFRRLAREQGCGLVYTEMLSDKALIYGSRRTSVMVFISPDEHPIAVQLLGSEPEPMAEAARLVAEAGADIIDINMGCPAPKVVKNGEGSALMRDPTRAAEVASAVVRAVDRPVTVKLRKGWDEGEVNVVEVARRLEDMGVVAVTVHGRVRTQFYSGRADWEIIAKVRSAVGVPVIGNGDVVDGPSARSMMVLTGCQAVMVGRAALGNPWIFGEILSYLRTGETGSAPTAAQRVAMARRHLRDLVAYKGEVLGVLEMRKHAAWYLHDLRGAARARTHLMRAATPREMDGILQAYLHEYDS